ncbi:hypothetical protein [Alkaliphilus peptidifermentans]|uniref:hypothetical protein n=1 Tax=Alkaliphilus peptidifermentans TaxID=426129 RepID=UPI0015A04BAB|nr:hypothetical protein [Alkaliphilus peptidifermentans]
MPDNIKEGKKASDYALLHLDELPTVEVPTSTKTRSYQAYQGARFLQKPLLL